MANGLIHIYYGLGKGKTTAALGLIMRCAGYGGQILLAQFLKGQPTGELTTLKKLPNVTVLRAKTLGKFTFQMTPAEKEETRQNQRSLWQSVCRFSKEKKPALIVCDELLDVCRLGFLTEKEVLSFFAEKPEKSELVLTGHQPLSALLDRADYVTEMKKIKHPYDRGLMARQGIER